MTIRYQPDEKSRNLLIGVHPDLIIVAAGAWRITTVDWFVTEGGRTLQRQRDLVKAKASQTMASKHLQQADGSYWAFDCAPRVNGQTSWAWPLFFQIAYAMRDSARRYDIPIRWGGCWSIINDIDDLEEAQAKYIARKRRERKRAFTDGPHFAKVDI